MTTPNDVRFAADGMLLSLGKWLRLLGYDCVGNPGHSGRALLEQAIAENRLFLTRNTHLREYLPKTMLQAADIIVVVGEVLPDQLREVVKRFSLDSSAFVFTRCIECNVPLKVAEIAQGKGLPPRVAAQQTGFWKCPRCGKLLWRGSHVANSMQRLQKWLVPSSASR